jgi:hypothetical protein
MLRDARASRLLPALVFTATLGLGASVQGCRTTTEDVDRWANTAQGPRKLVAVLLHDKYPLDLRVESAMTMVRMKPRNGRRVGIENLTAALAELTPPERGRIVTAMVPRLEAELRRPPAPPGGKQADPSFPYKDAAYSLLTQEDGTLVESPDNRNRLKLALADWAMVNFAERLEESSQMYGFEQLLRLLGAEGVRRLPEQIDPDARKIDRMADLIAELGNPETKLRASAKLVGVARDVNTPKWIDEKRPAVMAANAASKLKPSEPVLKQQLETYQEEELLRVFASLKKIGGAPAVDYLIEFAKDKSNSEKRRAAAMAALEGHLDRNNPGHVQAMLDIASASDTPNLVRDVALRRVGELPRKAVVSRLYELFKNDNWKVRWVAAELVLRMSDTSQVDEFMRELGGAKGMAMTEPLRYGPLIGEMKGSTPPEKLVQRYMGKGHPVQARLSALGYYYERGTTADLPLVDKFADDKTKVPACNEGAEECEWKCAIDVGANKEEKNVETVGDFVRYCLKPAMEKRTEPPKKGDSK